MNPNSAHTEIEKQRLRALYGYNILDTLPEEELDALTKLAASICNSPIALISLIDKDRQWFKSNIGLKDSQTSLDVSFCKYAIHSESVYEINDATKNDLFSNNPLVTNDPNIRFYAGAPLVTPEGYKLGTLCVMDREPKKINEEQKNTLLVLAKLVMTQFELRRKKIELEEQITLYNRRVEDVGDIIYTSDFNGNFNFINHKVHEILGYKPEELIGKSFRSLIVPGWVEKVDAFYHEQFKSRVNKTTLEFPVITKNGEARWVEQTVTAYLKDGLIHEFHGIVRDIEQRKSDQQKLIQSEEKFYSLFSLSPVPMALICVDDGEYTEVNDAFIHMTGYSTEEIVGKTVRELNMISESTRNEIQAAAKRKRYLKGKELVLNARSGKKVHVVLSTEMVEVDGKEHLLSIYHNITKRKELETELIRAKEFAEQSATAKERFLANMSHEIRTPMNAVLGFTDLLTSTDLNNDQKEYIESIQTAGKNLMTIINDILDYSKIEAGMMTLEESPLSVRSIFSSLEMMFFPKAQEKNLQLVFDCDRNIPEVLIGDPTRLTQIIINLVGNGIKFTETGGVKVIAWLVNKTEKAAGVMFQVHDSGIGIPADKVDFVFDRFNQVSNDTTRKYGGTGLGLSIVKKLVELHGGQVSVSSEFGKGSVFEFSIPFKYSFNEQITDVKKSTSAKTTPLQKSLNVLLVEDNILNQKLAGKVLTNMGHIVELAGNGKIAVDKLKQKTYDLVLMDMQMPEMDGYEAAVIIRKELKNNVPIIAMTAHAMSGEREKCINLGMNDYISKPFKVEELEFRIKSLFLAHSSPSTSIPKMKNSVYINLDSLHKLANGDETFKNEILEIFINETPGEMKALDKAVAESDFRVIESVAHKFISSIALVGLKQKLHTVLIEMESLAGGKSGIKRIRELNKILQEVARVSVEEAKKELKN
jgi:PAS domain S-box-containing protein